MMSIVLNLSVEEAATVIAALEGWLDALGTELPEDAARVRSVLQRIVPTQSSVLALGTKTREELIFKIGLMIMEGEFDVGDANETTLDSPFGIVAKIFDLVKGNHPELPDAEVHEFARFQAKVVIDAYWDHKRGEARNDDQEK